MESTLAPRFLKQLLLAGSLCLLSYAPAARAQKTSGLDVHLAFANNPVLLGEPVWIVVTAHNATTGTLPWNPGDYCFMFQQYPVTAVIPDAAPGPATPQPCSYGFGGDCPIGYNTVQIAPGESDTSRFLLEGDFHFTHPGNYPAQLTAHPKGPGATPITQAVTLVIQPKDDAVLLVREQKMAANMEAALLTPHLPPAPETQNDRMIAFRRDQNLWQIRRGLATHPAPGMEAVFEHWLSLPNSFENDAMQGLKNLNSKASRKDLAVIAASPVALHDQKQWIATRDLADMGDPSYYPLMLQLLHSPDQEVRRSAIVGMGTLGGSTAVPKLTELVRTGSSVESNDALHALGSTQSRAAVKALIDLLRDGHADATWPLFILTHQRMSSTQRSQQYPLWQRWWNTGGSSAPVYSPYECAPKEAFHFPYR